MRRPLGFIALLVLALAGFFLRGGEAPTGSLPSAPAAEPAGGYILALSWSPAWCEEEDPAGRTDQCALGRKSGLVVHGLWAGSREDDRTFCSTGEPERLPKDLAARVRGFMPSLKLAVHEWKKHGSCMGLGQRGYFDTMEKAWRAVRVPEALSPPSRERQIGADDLSRQILAANPSLPREAVSLQCDREGDLSEVRICLTGTLAGRPCPAGTGRGCPRTLTILPPP